MSNQPRVVKVLAALLFSMTMGAIVLMSLGQNPPAAGPWSLSRSLRADPAQFSVDSIAPQSPARWNRIEIWFSGTDSGDVDTLAGLSGLANPKDLNCHFVVCNGLGGEDGHVLVTEKWLRQRSIIPEEDAQGGNTTIRICVVGDGKSFLPTDLQMRQTQGLVKKLSRTFLISEPVFYPTSWRF